MDMNIPAHVTDACDLRDAEHHRGLELLAQLRTGRAEARPGAVAKIRRVTGTGTTLMGFYGGIVRALQPLTRGELLGPRIEDYGYRLLEELVTQAEERLKADEEDM